MNLHFNRLLLVGLSALCLIFLPGCWDYQAINTKATIVGLGIDPVPDHPEKIRLTIQYPNLAQEGASKGGEISNQSGSIGSFLNETADGYSIAEILNTIQTRIDRNIDTNQMRAVVFSERLSPMTMDDVVGELLRRPQFNPLAYAVASPDSAQKIMETQSKSGSPMDIIDRKFSEKMQQHGYAVRRQIWEYWRDRAKIGVTPILPLARSVPLSSEPGQTSGGDIQVGGFVVYGTKGQLRTVTDQETLWVNLLMGSVQSMAIDIPVDAGVLSIASIQAQSKRGCKVVNGRIQLIDKVSIRARLARTVSGNNISPSQPSSLNRIQDEVKQYLLPQMKQELSTFQQQGTDIFGFSQYYLQRHPDEEATVKQNWSEMFRSAQPQLDLTVHMTTGGMLI